MIFAAYQRFQKIRNDSECNSKDELLGTFSTVYVCSRACSRTTGCKYFIYGKVPSEQGTCKMEKTLSENCPEGWEDDTKYDFYKQGNVLYK